MTPADAERRLLQALREASTAGLRAHDEWAAVVEQAARQGLAPLLHAWITREDRGADVPEGVLDRLTRERMDVAARNMLLASELGAILTACEAGGLRCAPLRGPALAESIWGDVTLRPSGDLDLLVRREELTEVTRVLGRLGFVEVDRRPGFARAYSYTLELVKQSHLPVVVEPHWTIAYPPFVDAVDMPGVWRRCARGKAVGVDAWLLGREDTFLNLCLHAAHRDDAPLLWLYELDRLARQDIDWREVVTLSRTAGVEGLVAMVLVRVRGFFATPVPQDALAGLGSAHERAPRSRLLSLLAAGAAVDGKESLALFLALPGLRARLRYVLALLFPTPAFMRLHYGVRRADEVARAYVGRLARFSWEALKGLLRLARRPAHV